MYFPTSAARVLSTVPALPNIPPEPVITLRPGPRKSLFCTLTRNGVTVWAVRVGGHKFTYTYCARILTPREAFRCFGLLIPHTNLYY
jgi:hypothetical protein